MKNMSFSNDRKGVVKLGAAISGLALLVSACAKEQDVNAFVDPTVPADQTYN